MTRPAPRHAFLLAGALALPLAAQTTVFDTTGLSQIPGNPQQNVALHPEWGGNYVNLVAQRFTTGTSGRTFSSVSFVVSGTSGPATASVYIYNDNSGSPGSSLTTLSGPAALTSGAATYTFTGSLALNPSTTYWVVWDNSAAGDSEYNLSVTAATSGGSGDWLTASDYGYKTLALGASTWNTGVTSDPTSAGPIRMTVTAVPEPATAAGLLGVAALSVVFWRRRSR